MNEKLLRTFISVTLPKSIVTLSKMLQTTVISRKNNIKWVSPGNIHLTLKFIGPTSVETANTINEILQKLVVDFEVINLEIKTTGCFPNNKQPRVLWLGVDGELDKLKNLLNNIDNELAKIGITFDTKKDYLPHITLGRIKYPPNSAPNIANFLNTSFTPLKFNVNRIRLIGSELFPNGPIYSILGTHIIPKKYQIG